MKEHAPQLMPWVNQVADGTPWTSRVGLPYAMPELYDVREERGLDCLFLAVVNIVELRSSLLCAGPSELSLAEARAGIEPDGRPPSRLCLYR